ncbi:MAG TPA: Cna B-type domain-containing protein, partial [Erysipelothrix sp.]|nr:Cna B-type domain-containing protein [Erysipelothrix sp.]
DVSVKKVWVGEKADSVTINLYADGKEVSHVKLTAENNWEHVFEDLDATTLDGEAITYTVDEVKLDGYETDIKGDAIEGFTVTNTQIKGEVGSKLPLTGSVSLGQLALISILLSGAFFSLNRKDKRNRYFD